MRLSLKLGIALVILALSTAAFAAQSSCDAVAGNLVTNCGFETGDLTGWTLAGNTGFTGVTSFAPYVNSGAYGAQLGPVGSDGTLTQSVVGTSTLYFLSMYLYNDGGTPNDFTVLWNGIDIGPDLANIGAFAYTQFSTIVPGVVGTNTVQFVFRQDPAYFGLDDLVITNATPEPGTLLTLGSGLLGLAGLARRRLFN